MAIVVGCLSWCTHYLCQTSTAFIISFLILLILTPSATSVNDVNDLSCQKLRTSGVTFPSGDINVEYGNPLEIFCILNPKKTQRNASSLVFESSNKDIPDKYLEVINSTTLRLYIEKPLPSENMYYCKLRAEPENNLSRDLVCLNKVSVGYKPTEVKNFSCISMNWENLTCTWDLPVNYVETTTKLEYYLPGRAGGRFSYPCPDRMEKHENRCFWDSSTSVVYRQPYDYYFFKMTVENPLGNLTQKIKFHHYAYVIPSKPVNSTVISKTSNSVLIQWSVGFPMQNFPPGVMQKVEYHTYYDSNDTWHAVNVSHLNRKAKTHTLNITGLKYPHTVYDIRIYMKSPDAVGDDKWSKPATLIVKTLPDVPGAPPKTDIGSFEVSRGLPYRDIYVYWQRIPEWEENGDNFKYEVYSENESGVESYMEPNKTAKAYARFESLGFKDYHLKIYSVNEVGRSKTGSDIYIPAVKDIVAEPLSITKIAFENGIYELSWKKSPELSKIVNYTIFWCDDKRDRPFQCDGHLNWMQVGKDTLIKNITVAEDKVYQFAVSANSHDSSSGMAWASCTVIHNKVVGKMKSVWVNSIGSSFIELGWKLECSNRVGVVRGFRIYYCPLADPGLNNCEGGVQSNTTIMGDPPLTGRGNVTGLIPFTTYMLSVSVLTKSGTNTGEGLQSDVLFNTTLEAAPDPPENVRVCSLTNISMVVSWDPPENMNGILRAYSVQIFPSDGRHLIETLDLNVTLNNLQSYTVYNVSVSARTTVSSPFVFAPSVRTLVGVPGIVEQPIISSVNDSNKSQMSVNWPRPRNPNGEINYYEYMLTRSNENRNETFLKKGRVYDNKTDVEMECEGVEHLGESLRYMVYIRAVNIRVEQHVNVTLYGQWSSPGLRNCYNPGFPEYVQFCIILFLMMAIVSIIFGCAYSANRVCLIWKAIKDVNVTLPAIFVQPSEKDSESHKRMHGLPVDMGRIDRPLDSNIYCDVSAPDQELLLIKKAENDCDVDGDRDSSGCSSAHESVSSSLTSGTHISDSGTEDQPESPPTLRQRIVSSGASGRDGMRLLQDQYVVLGANEISPNASSSDSDLAYSSSCPRFVNRPAGGIGYCVVGSTPVSYPRVDRVDASINAQLSSVTSGVYVTQPPIQSDSKNAVSPVSISVSPSVQASKGYVMAGSMVQNPSSGSTLYPKLATTSDYVTLPSTSKTPSEL